MSKAFDNSFEVHERTLRNHVLTEQTWSTPECRAFRLHREVNSRACSVDLLFMSAFGYIVIAGDFAPNRGVISDLGYGLAWFTSALSQSYLAEKFMSTEWCYDRAAEEINDMIARPEDYGLPTGPAEDETEEERATATERLERSRAALFSARHQADCLNMNSMIDYLYSAGVDILDGTPGYGYDPNESALLSAIQQRFAALYNSRAQ